MLIQCLYNEIHNNIYDQRSLFHIRLQAVELKWVNLSGFELGILMVISYSYIVVYEKIQFCINLALSFLALRPASRAPINS